MAMYVKAVVGTATMPVFLARREPDHIAGMDFLDRSHFALNPAAAGGDNESLAERVLVPCSPRTRFESYAGTLEPAPDRVPEIVDRCAPCQ
jgi:hypothetical protein